MGCGPAAEPAKPVNKLPAPAPPASGAPGLTEVKKEVAKVEAAKPGEVKKEEKKLEPVKPLTTEVKKVEGAAGAKKEAVPEGVVEKAGKPAETKLEQKAPEIKANEHKVEEKKGAEAPKPAEVKPMEVKKEAKPVEELKITTAEQKVEPVHKVPEDPLKVLAQYGYSLPKTQIEEDTEPVHAVHNMMYAGAIRAAAESEVRQAPTTNVMSGILPSVAGMESAVAGAPAAISQKVG